MDERNRGLPARAIVVMGPAGSGKTTVGLALAGALGVRFIDADHEHGADSVDKMRRGIPLDESDRGPWLTKLHSRLLTLLEAGQTVVLACSALTRLHRNILKNGDRRITFVYLRVPPAVLAERLAVRRGHFAGLALLPSQLAVFEPPDGAVTVAGTASPETVVSTILELLQTDRT